MPPILEKMLESVMASNWVYAPIPYHVLYYKQDPLSSALWKSILLGCSESQHRKLLGVAMATPVLKEQRRTDFTGARWS